MSPSSESAPTPLTIAVAGGTGVVGRHVVAAATSAGHSVRVLARATGVDLRSPEHLADHLAGVDVVVDASGISTLDEGASVAFFESVTSSLLRAEAEACVRHHVALSIVGAAAAPSGHYAGKARQERLLQESGAAWTILRTTQFHEFVTQVLQRSPLLGVHLVPSMRTQPVAAAEVADELVHLAEQEPAGFATDLGGPAEEKLTDLARRYLAATGGHGPVVPVPVPGPMGRAMRSGGLLPGPGALRGRQTFDEWLRAVRSSPGV